MGKVSRKIWWIATPALLAALLFQLYWLKQTYRSQQEAFVATATEAFHSAYDHSIIITAHLKAGVEPQEKRRYSIQTTIDLDENANAASDGMPRAKGLSVMIPVRVVCLRCFERTEKHPYRYHHG
ncbi:hypothetical protein [Chitinophaga pinensis]|uniref:Uncharacterized protein n=1 Tax=Chitinophaga pinensis TaxID=79329 RepID=A0A5C6LLP4_9BACT|nr:hypothetical protein [Chitinophaga pinensis]TWV93026.1 hypothetical protein FEF09_27675 [Chitinophaga pinensis]